MDNVLDTLAASAREHTGSGTVVPEVATACDAWTSYCKSNNRVNFNDKIVKELDIEVARMVWDKIPASTIAEACSAYWAGHDTPCPVTNVHAEAAMPYAIGRLQNKMSGLFGLLLRSDTIIKRQAVKRLKEKAAANPVRFVLTYLPGAASMTAVASLTSQDMVNYLVLLHLNK